MIDLYVTTSQTRKMDDYKLKLCEFVQNKPLLWDPRHKDYKNKDQRTQAWEYIEEKLPSPDGTNAKDEWMKLWRCFSNARERRKKKSGSGSDDTKPWKFERAMEFVITVKESRNTVGNLDTVNGEVEEVEEADENDEEAHTPITPSASFSCSSSTESKKSKSESATSVTKRRKLSQSKSDSDAEAQLMIALKNKLEKKDSARMGFFRSIMPQVEAMNDEQFLCFQFGVLRSLKDTTANDRTTSQDSTWPLPAFESSNQRLVTYQDNERELSFYQM